MSSDERSRSNTPKNNADGLNKAFTPQQHSLQDILQQRTVGLVQLEEFQKKRDELLEQKTREALQVESAKRNAGGSGLKKAKKKAKLSFEDEEEDNTGVLGKEKLTVKKSGKDRTIDTSFLADPEREEAQAKEREVLRQQWIKKQEALREESVEIPFVYFDGISTPGNVTVKKGETIATFLDRARRFRPQLKFRSTDDLLLVRGDIIIPQHYEFYYFIVNKVNTRRGPLFDFGRLEENMLDTKIIERKYFDKNKHIYPLNAYHQYQPEVDYTTYVSRDKEGNVLGYV